MLRRRRLQRSVTRAFLRPAVRILCAVPSGTVRPAPARRTTSDRRPIVVLSALSIPSARATGHACVSAAWIPVRDPADSRRSARSLITPLCALVPRVTPVIPSRFARDGQPIVSLDK